MDDNDLWEFFKDYGLISSAEIIVNKKTRLSKGIATVTFKRIDDAESVLNLPKDKLVCGKKILNPIPARCSRVWKFNKNKGKKNVEQASSEVNVEESDDDSLINRLPNEILSYIFSYLVVKERIRSERVCKRWRFIGKNIPWSDVQTLVFRDVFKDSTYADRMDSKTLHEILSRCGATIKELDFADCPHHLSRQFPVIITNHCPNLLKIDIAKTELDNKSLKILAEETPNLQSINLSACNLISEKGVKCLLKNCLKLTELYLDNIKNIAGYCLEHLNENIELLSLNNCSDLKSDALKNIANRCKNLQILKLNFCLQLDNTFSMVEMFKILSESLKEFCMSGYFQNLSTQIFAQSFKFANNLRVLNLEGNMAIDDSVIQVISSQCQELEFLNINRTNITDESFLYIRFMVKLKTLSISYNVKISDTGMEQVAQAASLENLELQGCHIGDDGCTEIVRNCQILSNLDVSNCYLVTQKTVDEALIRKPANASRLTIIAGGTGIEKFVETESLEVVNINKCPHEYRQLNEGLFLHNDEFDEDAVDEEDYDQWSDYGEFDDGLYDDELEEMM